MNITKILTSYLFRVMAAWFGVYVADKIKFYMNAAIAYVIDKAGVVYLGSTENVQTVLDFFNTHDLTVGSGTYRYIGEVAEEQAPAALFVYQFGRLTDAEGHVSTDEVVYGNRRDYDDLAEGSTVYAGSTEQTVSEVRLPTQGFVSLTGFTEPLHVMEGTNYMN